MTLELPIEEYFKYHPPTTSERIALHDRVNRESLEICNALINADAIFSDKEVDRICDRAIKLASETCWDEECVTWAIKSIDKARQVAIIIPPEETREADILMHIQQFRMFLNQGITVDELKRQRLAVAGDPSSIAGKFSIRDRIKVKLTDFGREELDRQHQELSEQIGKDRAYTPKTEDAMGLSDWLIEDLMMTFGRLMSPGSEMCFEEDLWIPLPEAPKPILKFDIVDGKIANIKPLYDGIHLTLDGDKWCALVGENLQVGIAGFGDDPIGALSDLYRELAGIELLYSVDSLGFKTVIDSYLFDTSNHERHSDFLRSYQQAILDRRNGMSSIESKMADVLLDLTSH